MIRPFLRLSMLACLLSLFLFTSYITAIDPAATTSVSSESNSPVLPRPDLAMTAAPDRKHLSGRSTMPMSRYGADGMIHLQKRSPLPVLTQAQLEAKRAKFKTKVDYHNDEAAKYPPTDKRHESHLNHQAKWAGREFILEHRLPVGSWKQVNHYRVKLGWNLDKEQAWKDKVAGNLEFWRKFHATTDPNSILFIKIDQSHGQDASGSQPPKEEKNKQ